MENALYEDGRVMSCSGVGVPDKRLGELPVAFVVLKQGAQATEEQLIESARSRYVTLKSLQVLVWSIKRILIRSVPSFFHDRLPAFAVPVMIVIWEENDPLPTNAGGKILKDPLRKKAAAIWEKRKKSSTKARL